MASLLYADDTVLFEDYHFEEAELVLVSDDELILFYSVFRFQWKRAKAKQAIHNFLSDAVITVPDVCRCQESPMIPTRSWPLSSAPHTRPESYPTKYRGRYPRQTVEEDAKLLGLGQHRKAVISEFQLPGDDGLAEIDGMMKLHQLCACCQTYFKQVVFARDPLATLLPPETQTRLHASVDLLRAAAGHGCHFCSVALYTLNRVGLLLDSHQDPPSTGVYIFCSYSQGNGRERVIWGNAEKLNPPALERPTFYVSLQPTGTNLAIFHKPGEDRKELVKFAPAIADSTLNVPLPM